MGADTSSVKPRARDLGIPFEGIPGKWNAITDVKGVEIGHTTLIRGSGSQRDESRVLTGVTAVLPRGKDTVDPVFGAWFSMNGSGEMTGTTWLEESGFLEGPAMITNSNSVGLVRDSVIAWLMERHPTHSLSPMPLVAETASMAEGGFQVTREHVFAALDGARSGQVPEGNVGGGTGTVCYGFKGGIGTASRRVVLDQDLRETRVMRDEREGTRARRSADESATDLPFHVGVLAQANHGRRPQLVIAGIPIGRLIPEGAPETRPERSTGKTSSLIVVIATDAPLLPHQLRRVVRRAALGQARNGSISGVTSGDIYVAFSTANPGAASASAAHLTMVPNASLNAFFASTVQATEEAIVNSMVAAETTAWPDGRVVIALPHDRIRALFGSRQS